MSLLGHFNSTKGMGFLFHKVCLYALSLSFLYAPWTIHPLEESKKQQHQATFPFFATLKGNPLIYCRSCLRVGTMLTINISHNPFCRPPPISSSTLPSNIIIAAFPTQQIKQFRCLRLYYMNALGKKTRFSCCLLDR